MAVDTEQKRMSAIHLRSPWRGPLVTAAESGFSKGNRQAAALHYSGIEADAPAAGTLLKHPGMSARMQEMLGGMRA